MVKRILDIVCACAGLLLTSPLLAAAAVAVRLSSRGGVIYRAQRAGLGGRPFTMYKLRTMRVHAAGSGTRITTVDDPRVFRIGGLLRAAKIDELPQLLNVLRGEMSLVGPRPEDPAYVREHYTQLHRETLAVRPGLTSPGTLYAYTQGHDELTGENAEHIYLERVLPVKLGLDLAYIRAWSLRLDLRVMARTVIVILGHLAGLHTPSDPADLRAARRWIRPLRNAAPPVASGVAGAE